MTPLTITAHFDGERIQLDEPVKLAPDTKLLVTVVQDASDEEREEWYRFAASNLGRAYAEDEPEYTVDMIKEFNPRYDGR